MSRAKEEAFNNMGLDGDFFRGMLHQVPDGGDEAKDYDIYLMETSLMPLLLQGLDALSRQVDKIATAERQNSKGNEEENRKPAFNPLIWLAQFLLRNHPSHVKDHRTPLYQQFAELASIERGRRGLLRRKTKIQEAWNTLIKDKEVENLELTDLPELMLKLDDEWHLGGQFAERMPNSFIDIVIFANIKELQVTGGESTFGFPVFWRWFESYVAVNDIIRASAFEEAEKRSNDEEAQARKALEDSERKERAIQEALEQRMALEDQFEMVSADMYISDEITRIMNKGASIQGVEQKEGGPSLYGEHISLLIHMLRLWGCPPSSDAPDSSTWGDAALAAWQRWAEARGLGISRNVDSVALKVLMSRESFGEYLARAFPVADVGGAVDLRRQVEVRSILGEEEEVIVEAIDEDTGDVVQLALLDSQVAEVRRRLQENTGEPLLAKMDPSSGRVMELLPETRMP